MLGKLKKKIIVKSKGELAICQKNMSYADFNGRFELSFELSKKLIAEAAVSKMILN